MEGGGIKLVKCLPLYLGKLISVSQKRKIVKCWCIFIDEKCIKDGSLCFDIGNTKSIIKGKQWQYVLKISIEIDGLRKIMDQESRENSSQHTMNTSFKQV